MLRIIGRIVLILAVAVAVSGAAYALAGTSLVAQATFEGRRPPRATTITGQAASGAASGDQAAGEAQQFEGFPGRPEGEFRGEGRRGGSWAHGLAEIGGKAIMLAVIIAVVVGIQRLLQRPRRRPLAPEAMQQ